LALSRITLFCMSLLLGACSTTPKVHESATSGPLFDELFRMDQELFQAAFITCDQNKFRSLLTEDLEFYHDRTGAAYGEDARTLNSCPRDNGVKRALVAGSLEVYPINNYGAVQTGRHLFTREGEPGAEVAKFVHLWQKKDGAWRLARVLSFDHRPFEEDR
jgi:hypothetical protein